MANNKNLMRPSECLTAEERRERASRAGKASGEARRARKTLREELLALLSDGDVQERLSLALIDEALNGNKAGSVTKAFEVIRDTVGEKPVDKVQMKTDVNIADSAERLNNIFEQIKEEK